MSILDRLLSPFTPKSDPVQEDARLLQLNRISNLLSAIGRSRDGSFWGSIDEISREGPSINAAYMDGYNKLMAEQEARKQRQEAMAFQKQLQDERLANERYIAGMRMANRAAAMQNPLDAVFLNNPTAPTNIPPMAVKVNTPPALPAPIVSVQEDIPTFKEDVKNINSEPGLKGLNVNKVDTPPEQNTNVIGTPVDKGVKIGLPTKDEYLDKKKAIIDHYNGIYNGLGDTLASIATYETPPDVLLNSSKNPVVVNNIRKAIRDINPDYSDNGYKSSLEFSNELNNGKSTLRQNLNNLNTLVHHIETARSQFNTLGNTSFKPWNIAKNKIGPWLGLEPNLNATDAIINSVVAEREKTLLNGKPTVNSLKSGKAELDINASPNTFNKALNASEDLALDKVIATLQGAGSSNGAYRTAYPVGILNDVLKDKLVKTGRIVLDGDKFYLAHRTIPNLDKYSDIHFRSL